MGSGGRRTNRADSELPADEAPSGGPRTGTGNRQCYPAVEDFVMWCSPLIRRENELRVGVVFGDHQLFTVARLVRRSAATRAWAPSPDHEAAGPKLTE
jgi:hypothetical protein